MGPFLSYAPPGVYTRTLTETNASNLVAGLRIPALIGVGQEELEQNDFELVRGSSATVDQQIVNEDVSESWVVDSTNPNNLQLGVQDGTLATFRVRNYPIVDGQGFGRVTNDVRAVSVSVNGTLVSLGSLNGQKGLVTIQLPTQPNDQVRVTYYFHRGDTAFTDDVSEQVSTENATLVSPGYGTLQPLPAPPDTYLFSIVTGVNDQFIVTANGITATVVLPGGTLAASSIASSVNAALVPNLSASVFTDNQGRDHLQLTNPFGVTIGDGTANGPLGWSAGASSNRNRDFRVFQRPIVDGSGGGTTTTDTSKVVAKVDGVQVVAEAVDGTNGIVTLPFAPAPGSTVTIQYWANTWQDTFDYLPNSLVTTVLRCGISPGRNDFIQGTDFVVSNPSTDVSVINWGSSFQVTAATTTPGATPFDGSTGSGGQIIGTLIDDVMFLGNCARVIDTSTIPATLSPTDYLLPEVPTTGNGRSTALGLSTFNSVANSRQDLVTNRPDLVKVYTGRTLRDALNRPAVEVLEVDGTTRRIKLKASQPPDYHAYATFYYSRLVDDTYIFTNVVPGAVGAGQYTVFSSTQNKNLFEVRFGTKTGFSQIVQWPRGVELIPDAFHTGDGTPISEVVTVTFGEAPATNAAFTNKGAAPYSFYSPFSATWETEVDGNPVTANLNTASPAVMVGARVPLTALGGTAITIPASPGNVLKLKINGVAVPDISIPAGAQTPAAIAGFITTGLAAATSPGTLATATFEQIGATGDVFFIIKSTVTPAALPGGFDTSSNVTIDQGTVESVLGFTAFDSVSGTSGAINKPATLLGSLIGPFNITAALNDKFNFRLNGVDYNVTLTAGAARTATQVVADINGVVATAASVGTGSNLNKVRLTSTTNDPGSSLVINAGSANAVLGFIQNDSASQSLVEAQELVNVLMGPTGFSGDAVAYVESIGGGDHITIESLTTGVLSSIGFNATTNSAFNPTTGTGIVPGTDGDIGEDIQGNYTVSSSASAGGSEGVGIPGQTYTDANTGLRFTVLPASTGAYTTGGQFTLEVTPTWHVSPSIPRYSIGGLELLVTNTVGVGVNDTASLVTYNPSGVEPAVGDFYFISYRYLKQDYSAKIYQQLKTIEAAFGRTSAENRVTLAAYLAILNGAVLIIIKQVLKVPNTNQASDAAFNAAIDELASPLPGNIRPGIVIPLATSTSVYTHLTSHCEIQSNPRNQSERQGFIGFASGTSPTSVQSIARALNSSRIVAFYPDSAVITLTDELGASFDSIVDGSFYAAAVSGAIVSPAVDVATPYTHRRIQGFTRIPRVLDPVEANQTAVAGVTILEDLDPIIRIRHGLTTNMTSVLTRLPTVIQIADFVQQQSRSILDSFVGSKFLAARTNEVVVSMTGLFRSLVEAEIVGAFTGMTASIDPDDPTILRFEMYYSPIFPLLYIVLTFNLRARLA
jgi:hypothetical protein